MRMTDNNFGSNLRLALAITATAGVMICLWLLLHSCTPQTLDDDRPTGTGIALRLGTVSMERGGKAPTRASSAITTMSGWEFASGDLLNVYVQATGSGTQASKGVYSRNSTGGWEPQYSTKAAYWQRSTGNTVSILWGPEADGKVYHLPDSYDALPGSDMKAKMWNYTKCTNFANLWRCCDLLHYQAADIPAQNTALSAELSHSMAQLCVELTAGKGMTEDDVKTATVSILGAYGCYTTDATSLQPVACQAEDATATSSPTTKDITLLKNGDTSLKHYALLLPRQVFPSSGRMIKISIGSGIYYYTPTGNVTPTAGNCLNLKLQVDKTAVNALNVSSTGWDSEVTTGEPPTTDGEVTVVPSTAGSLTLPTNLSGTDNKLMITGQIDGEDLKTLSKSMDKFSELYINATLSGTTALPEEFAKNMANLKVITLPKGMTRIENYAFRGCAALTSISLPEGVTSIGNSAFSGCAALTSISLPEGVTSIGSWAFGYCAALTSISLPEGVKSIGIDAFYGCAALTSISLPKELTSIGERTFCLCAALTSISLPKGVTSIGREAFSSCAALTSISLPEKLTSIGSSAFHGCKALTSISLPEKVTKIEEQTFDGCAALTSISLPEGVTSIGNSAFNGCIALTSISLPEKLTSIGNAAFNGCKVLTSISLPEGVTSIGNSAFYGCAALTSISLPKGVASIGSWTFNGCTALTSISLPEKLTSIENAAFKNCTALTKVILLTGTTLPTCGNSTTFNMQSPSPVLFLPAISAEEFAAATDKYTKWGSPTPAWSAVHYAYSPGSGTTPADYANPDNYLGHWP
ncbi:Fimbrillin-like [Bacteroides stercorirosoris]|uniref:Fimbrillin-like n=2 Tax=Bacteroides stercorirosoris TaxID=871324 RepID=A0A1M6BVJ7_9BACE|nr:Fimbrillin-like [Bacteroides stercorirosoris]